MTDELKQKILKEHEPSQQNMKFQMDIKNRLDELNNKYNKDKKLQLIKPMTMTKFNKTRN